MAHKGHPECPHSSKAACEKARRMAIGQCSSMVGETESKLKPCPHWGVEVIEGRPYCGQHANSQAIKADERIRTLRHKAELDARIDAHMAWVRDHPSVWDERVSA